MPSALLPFLLLLGGYVFTHLWHLSRFRAQGLDGYRLVFEAGLAGCVFLFPARVLVQWLKDVLPDSLLADWYAMTAGTSFVGTTIVAFAMAPAAASLANLVVGWQLQKRGLRVPSQTYARFPGRLHGCARCWKASRLWSQGIAVSVSGDALQQIFFRAATDFERGFTVGITMSNRRIYAAFVARAPNLSPVDSQYVRLVPLMSGFRSEDKLEVEYEYGYPLRSIGEWDDAVMTVPVSEIISAHLLSPEELETIAIRVEKVRAAKAAAGASQVPAAPPPVPSTLT